MYYYASLCLRLRIGLSNVNQDMKLKKTDGKYQPGNYLELDDGNLYLIVYRVDYYHKRSGLYIRTCNTIMTKNQYRYVQVDNIQDRVIYQYEVEE